jgi:predicted 3-demethylubiquinone-9 3-methyltransferase (glyoxalase superfamily)
MQNQINLCLWFDGEAKAAAAFYCNVFKNSKITTDTPMVVIFELDGTKMMGLNGGPNFKMNPSISNFVYCESIAETNAIWDKLIIEGKALIAIGEHPWSKCYGWLQDKYGFTWQISIANPGEKKKIVPALLFTGPQFGKGEEALKRYMSIFTPSKINVLFNYPDGDAIAGKLMYADVMLGKNNIIAMDGPGVHDYTFNEGVSIMVDCETQEEIDHYWQCLIADGGEESRCGWLKDRYGVSWQIVPSNIGQLMTDPARAGRVMQAVMQMKKLSIEKMMNA